MLAKKTAIIALSGLINTAGVAFADSASGSAGASPIIAAFGDSLSAGYQLPPQAGFAPVLQRRLQATHAGAVVVNAAIAGETSSDARLRVGWMLKQTKPDLVILAFGANDMLMGLPTAALYDNLSRVISEIQASGAKVLLAGMLAPHNAGERYQAEFQAVYTRLAQEYNVKLYPFFLEGVATVVDLNLPDGLHPNEKGVAVMVDNILPTVIEVLDAKP